MPNTYFAADLHLSHANILKFKYDDKPLRPFASIEEHDETIVDNWNKTVRDCDVAYVVGDAVFRQDTGWAALERLRGKKILVIGNHDPRHGEKYRKYFVDMVPWKFYDDMIVTHIPIHPMCVGRWKHNVHGHTHAHQARKVYRIAGNYGPSDNPDPRYLCVSMEQIDYTPISIDDVRKRIKKRDYDYEPACPEDFEPADGGAG